MPDTGTSKPFEIGLVMAGAISAGAYTAGVCDFLIQALDAWEAAKADPAAKVPRHDVRIKALAGASAGAMTSAIAAVALNSEVDPVVDPGAPPPAERNRFYDAWVRQIDIAKLLGTRDIKAGGSVASLLDSTALAEIAGEALKAPRRAAPRSYVADPLAVMLTVANLRGVPYGFNLFGDRKRVYGMVEHMDHMRFAVSWRGQGIDGALVLDPAKGPGDLWPNLALAALASGAFPVGLAPRVLSRPRLDYRGRHRRDPIWDAGGGDLNFLCVDGGLMDNEPLEIARRRLAEADLDDLRATDRRNPHEGERRNPRDGVSAHRAVVMIDPFPNEAAFDEGYAPNASLVSVAARMFGALKNQARFKAEELDLAEQDNVFSRFMISPSRPDAGRTAQEPPAMASAILGGFGGFFHESFRAHDFQLGRRNAQAFLKWHFSLPVTNTVFAGADRALLESWKVVEPDGSVSLFRQEDGTEVPYAPIVPLVGSAAAEVPLPARPTGRSVDTAALRKLVARRVEAVGKAIIDSDMQPLFGGTVRWLIKKAWKYQLSGNVTDKSIEQIEKELRRLP